MTTLILDILLALLAVYMLVKGHYGITKQAAAVPLLVSLLDAAFAGAIDPALTPVLSAAQIVLQVVILAAAATLTYQDAVHARNKRARRRRRQEIARSRAAFEQAAQRRGSVVIHHPACA